MGKEACKETRRIRIMFESTDWVDDIGFHIPEGPEGSWWLILFCIIGYSVLNSL